MLSFQEGGKSNLRTAPNDCLEASKAELARAGGCTAAPFGSCALINIHEAARPIRRVAVISEHLASEERFILFLFFEVNFF